jgi:hypothetical protein
MIAKRAIRAMSSVTEDQVNKAGESLVPVPEERESDVIGIVPEGDLRQLKTVILSKIAALEEALKNQHPTAKELHDGIALSNEISQMNDLFWLELGVVYSQVQNNQNLLRAIFQDWKIVCARS